MRTYKTAEPVDVCVIGSGTGGVIARVLAEAGMSVVLLDNGPFWNPTTDFINNQWVMEQRLTEPLPVIYAGDKTGPGERMPHGIGGAMNHYGAFTVRFRPSTFLPRSTAGWGD